MEDIVLIHRQLYSSEAENLGIEPAVDFLVGSYEGDMMKPLHQALKASLNRSHLRSYHQLLSSIMLREGLPASTLRIELFFS